MKYLVIGQDFGCSNFEVPVFHIEYEAENTRDLLQKLITELYSDGLPENLDMEDVEAMKTFVANCGRTNDEDEDGFYDDIAIEFYYIIQLDPFEIIIGRERRETIY